MMKSDYTMKIRPRSIRLEAATACQLKCPSCPTATGQTGKKLGVGFLRFHDFKNILDKNPSVSIVELSNWGEIFLNKELIKIIKYAYEQNVALYAKNGANLNNVDKDVLEGLVKYKFREITCSIDGATNETYSIYRVKGNFDQVIENVKTINTFKAQYNSIYPLLVWQFVAFGHNEHEISKAREMAKDLNMSIYIKLSWDDFYTDTFFPIRDPALIRKETGLGVANRAEYRKKYGDYLKRCCLHMWSEPQINYDGRVLGCCVNHWGDYGNVYKDGLYETLNNEKMNYARDMLMGKREERTDIPCTQCKVYKNMQESKDWLTPPEIREKFTERRRYIMLENKVFGDKSTKRLLESLVKVKSRLRRLKIILKKGGLPARSFFTANIRKRREKLAKLTPQSYPLQIPLPADQEKGWKPYSFFKGYTPNLSFLSCHASVLAQNHCPHPAHKHKEEEILVLLAGEVDLIIADAEGKNRVLKKRLKPGQLVYYPAHFPHTIQTVSKDPANYLMFKWYNKPRETNLSLAHELFNLFDNKRELDIEDGLIRHLVFEGETDCLQKLHCHASILTPGAGYDPHIDDHDVAIIVLEGEVETLGERMGPHSVIFYPADEPHGMRNPGESTAKYVVFEFHYY